jgi:hypothetical protein
MAPLLVQPRVILLVTMRVLVRPALLTLPVLLALLGLRALLVLLAFLVLLALRVLLTPLACAIERAPSYSLRSTRPDPRYWARRAGVSSLPAPAATEQLAT